MVNDSVEMFCNSTGFPAPMYFWFKGNRQFHSGNSSSFVIDSTTISDSGTYWCGARTPYFRKSSERRSLFVWCKYDGKSEHVQY